MGTSDVQSRLDFGPFRDTLCILLFAGLKKLLKVAFFSLPDTSCLRRLQLIPRARRTDPQNSQTQWQRQRRASFLPCRNVPSRTPSASSTSMAPLRLLGDQSPRICSSSCPLSATRSPSVLSAVPISPNSRSSSALSLSP